MDEEVKPVEETVSEEAAPSEEVVTESDGSEETVSVSEDEPVTGEEVVVDQAMLDENPELAEAGVEVGDVGEVVDAPLEGEALEENLRERANDVLENPESIQAGDPVPSDGEPV
jgi:hypothetical protein